jgi:lipopolysaccharide transport system ATP-binding protein
MTESRAISVDRVAKRYRLGARVNPYGTLRESVVGNFTRSIRSVQDTLKRERKAGDRESREFWALRDVSFEVRQGEVIGVIGRNGAGKSTLLKLLSEITEPTQGSIRIWGRTASLLEVGTGFHPELTGRENIYLNGAVLGMSRAEITKKFDEIVDFAGVGKFIDTQVKHFSSGMYLRLAFSVAAHLEPEILLVDEVLAVGDAQFQKKCLGKMEGVARAGRTVLLVSHNMSAIKQLCSRTLFLEGGRLKLDAKTDQAIKAYLQSVEASGSAVDLSRYENPYGHGEVEVLTFALVDPVAPSFTAPWDRPLRIRIRIRIKEKVRNVSVAVGCMTIDGVPLFTVRSSDARPEGYSWEQCDTADVVVEVRHNLRAGQYDLVLGIASGNYNYFYHPSAAQLEISDIGDHTYPYRNDGIINCEARWTE